MDNDITLSDLFNGLAGIVFQYMGGVDRLIQSIQLAIVLIGSNPYVNLNNLQLMNLF